MMQTTAQITLPYQTLFLNYLSFQTTATGSLGLDMTHLYQ